MFELLTGGDLLFQPASGAEFGKDDDHLAQIVELCGPYPRYMIETAYYSRDFFDSKGNLRNIADLRPWPLKDVLHDKYGFSRTSAADVSAFLGPMLRVDPARRASAAQALRYPWLRGVVVQGEIERKHTVGKENDEEEIFASYGMAQPDFCGFQFHSEFCVRF